MCVCVCVCACVRVCGGEGVVCDVQLIMYMCKYVQLLDSLKAFMLCMFQLLGFVLSVLQTHL